MKRNSTASPLLDANGFGAALDGAAGERHREALRRGIGREGGAGERQAREETDEGDERRDDSHAVHAHPFARSTAFCQPARISATRSRDIGPERNETGKVASVGGQPRRSVGRRGDRFPNADRPTTGGRRARRYTSTPRCIRRMRIPFLSRLRPVRLPGLAAPSTDQVRNFFAPVFWGTSDRQEFTDLMTSLAKRTAPGIHFGDNLFTWGRNNSMLDDEAFVKSWSANAETDVDRAIVWRRYILACAAHHAVQLRGDFVECGAYTGAGVKTVIDYLGGTAFPATFWLYDLFEHAEGMLHHAMPEHGPRLHERVVEKFRAYPQVRIVKGNIPDVFRDRSPAAITYLHIDLNEAPAEVAALDALFDRVVAGGIVILDDYEWAGLYRPQKLREDPWFEARGYRVFPLPTGQGIVIKR